MAPPFTIEPAQCPDFPWIIDAHVETALETLPPLRRSAVDIAVMRRYVSEEISKVAENDGNTCALLVARKPEGELVGFVWMSSQKSRFSDDVKAFVLGIYVAQDHRRQGIGKTLMRAAEEWATSHGHHTVALQVGAYNTPALNMYGEFGFGVDTKTMSKTLS